MNKTILPTTKFKHNSINLSIWKHMWPWESIHFLYSTLWSSSPIIRFTYLPKKKNMYLHFINKKLLRLTCIHHFPISRWHYIKNNFTFWTTPCCYGTKSRTESFMYRDHQLWWWWYDFWSWNFEFSDGISTGERRDDKRDDGEGETAFSKWWLHQETQKWRYGFQYQKKKSP